VQSQRIKKIRDPGHYFDETEILAKSKKVVMRV
jgi:hypothetical protein